MRNSKLQSGSISVAFHAWLVERRLRADHAQRRCLHLQRLAEHEVWREYAAPRRWRRANNLHSIQSVIDTRQRQRQQSLAEALCPRSNHGRQLQRRLCQWPVGESTISYSLAPALGTTIVASVPITTADKNQYILIDITPAVVAWLNGSVVNDGIALVANGAFNAAFDSKENTTSSHPPRHRVYGNRSSGTSWTARTDTNLQALPALRALPVLRGFNGQGFNFLGTFDPNASYNV